MPRPKEGTADDDSLDTRTPNADEEEIVPHQFQPLKRTEYDAVHLSPGKSALKVLWDRVSAEIAQRSSHSMQAGIKESSGVRKTWSPAIAHLDEHAVSQQRPASAGQAPSADIVWDRVSTVIERKSYGNVEILPQVFPVVKDLAVLRLSEPEHEMPPSLAARQSAMVVWDRVSTAIERQSVADVQDHSTHSTESREERNEVEAEKEGSNLSLNTSNRGHQGMMGTEDLQDMGTEEAINSKSQDSSSDFAPRIEQEDQDSVEEKVTTYDALNKEQLEEDVPLEQEPKDLAIGYKTTFDTKKIPDHIAEYLEERRRPDYPHFIMDSQQTRLVGEEIQEDVKPQHMHHEDVPESKTVESLEMKREDSGEEGVPYLSYNPPQTVQAATWDGTEQQGMAQDTTGSKLQSLRKELDSLEAFHEDDDDESYFYNEDPPAMDPGAEPEYQVPDPVRARVDDDVLLYHMPRSPDAPRRLTEKAFFKFK